MQFPRGDEASRKRERTDEDRKSGSHQRKHRLVRFGGNERQNSGEHGGGTAEPVQQTDHLRHLNHFDANRRDDADQKSDKHRDIEEPDVENIKVPKCQGDREQHAQGAEGITENRRLDFAHHRNADKNEHRKDARGDVVKRVGSGLRLGEHGYCCQEQT